MHNKMLEDPMDAMTNKDRFLRALFADSEREKLVNFKLFPGFDRDVTPDEVFGVLSDAINKERLGILDRIDLDKEEAGIKDFTIEDLKKI